MSMSVDVGNAGEKSHRCTRCSQLSLRPAFLENAPDGAIPLGRPIEWDPDCSVCQTFASLALADLPGLQSEHQFGELYRLVAFDTSDFIHDSSDFIPGSNRNGAVSIFARRPMSFAVSPQEMLVAEMVNMHFMNGVFDHAAHGRLQLAPTKGFDVPYALRAQGASLDAHLVRSWITHCIAGHERCRPRIRRRLPSLRLNDCSSGLIVINIQDTPYLALSYVWSEVEEDITHVVGARMNTQCYQYVWIDRYCIDQSSATHRAEQIQNMGTIYDGADATIIAADSADGRRDGLTGVSRSRKGLTTHLIDGLEYAIAPLLPSRAIEKSAWHNRAWTYQESVLSRRRVVVLEDQIYFECVEESRSDALHGVLVSFVTRRLPPAPYAYVFEAMKKEDSFVSHVYNHLRVYTKRNMTHARDALNAIQGVLDRIQIMYLENGALNFFYGLPIQMTDKTKDHVKIKSIESTILEALSWSRKNSAERRIEFPSWTLAGWYNIVPAVSKHVASNTFSVTFKMQDNATGSLVPLDTALFHAWSDARNQFRYSHLHVVCPIFSVQLKPSDMQVQCCFERIEGNVMTIGRAEGISAEVHDAYCRYRGTLRYLALDMSDYFGRLRGLLVRDLPDDCVERLDYLNIHFEHMHALHDDLVSAKRDVVLL
ncbi:hypothetical protein LTR95_010361 [Oleoguttula sp. CCFEE 5521]